MMFLLRQLMKWLIKRGYWSKKMCVGAWNYCIKTAINWISLKVETFLVQLKNATGMKLKCLIVDDEPLALDLLETHISLRG